MFGATSMGRCHQCVSERTVRYWKVLVKSCPFIMLQHFKELHLFFFSRHPLASIHSSAVYKNQSAGYFNMLELIRMYAYGDEFICFNGNFKKVNISVHNL